MLELYIWVHVDPKDGESTSWESTLTYTSIYDSYKSEAQAKIEKYQTEIRS